MLTPTYLRPATTTRYTGKPLTKPMSTRQVRTARRRIAREACPDRRGIQHRWTPLGGLYHRCVNCDTVT